MRASVVTTLMAWAMLAGLGLIFAQLTQLQGFRVPGHPVIGWAYAIFDGALAVSALTAAVGGLPLWLLMLRRAHPGPGGDRRDRHQRQCRAGYPGGARGLNDLIARGERYHPVR
jgi:hypothetical protein